MLYVWNSYLFLHFECLKGLRSQLTNCLTTPHTLTRGNIDKCMNVKNVIGVSEEEAIKLINLWHSLHL